MHFSNTPEDLVILCPYALLWPGKYDFAATPLAGINWGEAAKKSSGGTCTNSNGTFFYQIRYLGNLPIIFAIAEDGIFPDGPGTLAQGIPFFPQDREKLPPPNFENKKTDNNNRIPSFREPEENIDTEVAASEAISQEMPATPVSKDSEIEPGSNDSVLLRKKNVQKQKRIQERQLSGENIAVERVKERRGRKTAEPSAKRLGLLPSTEMPTLSGGRPSPFGPRTNNDGDEASQPDSTESRTSTGAGAIQENKEGPNAPELKKTDQHDARNDNAGSASSEQNAVEESRPATLPGGRPSPFGPR